MKNKSGQPFNPVTQEYKEGDAGEAAVCYFADENYPGQQLKRHPP